MNSRIVTITLALLTLSGCGIDLFSTGTLTALAVKHANEVALSKRYLAKLQAHDFSVIEQNIEPYLKNGQLSQNLEKMAVLFPAGNPTDVKLIGLSYNVFAGPKAGYATTSVTFEYEFPRTWLAASVVLRNEQDKLTIAGIHVRTLPDSLEHMNKFSLHGKGLANYLVLAACVTVPVFILVSLLACFRTPIPKRKWLWICILRLDWERSVSI
jgi:hypothetical protein